MARAWRGRSSLSWVLVGLLGALGVRGLAGGAQFVLVPSGDVVGVSTAVLAPTPVRNFLIPGLFLFGVLGVCPLVVASGLYAGRRWARIGAIAVGCTLVGWAVVEGLVLGFGERLQYFNFAYGIVLVALSVASTMRTRREP